MPRWKRPPKPEVGDLVVSGKSFGTIMKVYKHTYWYGWDVDVIYDGAEDFDTTYVPRYAQVVPMEEILRRYLRLDV